MEENFKIKENSEEELRELKAKYDAEIRTVTKNAKKTVKKAKDKSFVLTNARKKLHAERAIASQKVGAAKQKLCRENNCVAAATRLANAAIMCK